MYTTLKCVLSYFILSVYSISKNMENTNYTSPATSAVVEKTIKALSKNNINVFVATSAKDVKEKVRQLIPLGAEVMTATSTSLDQMGISSEINESGKYDSVKAKLMKLDREKDGLQMQKLGAAPEYVIGSVHAVTEDGKVVIASGSGSQLPAYSYGATHVVWIVSTKKIVKNIEEAIDRIYKHVLPLEDARMKKVYGPESGSKPRKILIVNEEINPQRINLIFTPEDLGF